MAHADAAERALRDGDTGEALRSLEEQVRAKPADAKLRVFLFQLLCVLGQWDRAVNQLTVAATLDPGALAMAQMYGDAVRCERLRGQVFAGSKSPLVLGEPEQWLALLIESRLRAGRGEVEQANALRERAFDEAPPSRGTLDGQAFAWLADADSRLGPVLETIISGRYYWVPFSRLSRVVIDAPTDLRDVVWMPAHMDLVNGGEVVALIPTRYPGSEAAEEDLIRLARKTSWNEAAPGVFHGMGQRLLATDQGEHPLMDVRELVITATQAEA